MRWPGIRVNEELNHQRHAQQGECGQPGGQAEQQQQEKKVFGPHCRMRCDLDRDQRQLVVIPKQRVGAVRDRQPALHLGAAGQEKDGTNAHPGYECQRVMRPNLDPSRRAGVAAPGQALGCTAFARLKRRNISKKCL